MHFACIEYRIGEKKMYFKKYERKNMKVLQVLGWDGTFDVGVNGITTWLSGTQSSSLAVFLDFKSYKV